MGHIVDDKGEKMSKTKGNMIKPSEIIEKAGVDAVRLQFCTSDVGNSKRFTYESMKELVIPFLTVLYNSKKYYEQLDKKDTKIKVEDKWILSKLNTLIQGVTKDLENYNLSEPFLKIAHFTIKDFSRGYIQMTRDRDDTKEVVGEVLEKISLLLAPFAPYMTENIYQCFSKDSVHLSEWPKIDKRKIDSKLEGEFVRLSGIIEKGLAERDKVQIGLKWPLNKITINESRKIRKELEDLIKSQLNVKKIAWIDAGKRFELDTKMTPELEAEGYARNVIRSIQAFRKELGLKPENKVKTILIVDEELKGMIEEHKNTVAEKTNSKELLIETESKETFKKKIDFKVKDKKGVIAITL